MKVAAFHPLHPLFQFHDGRSGRGTVRFGFIALEVERREGSGASVFVDIGIHVIDDVLFSVVIRSGEEEGKRILLDILLVMHYPQPEGWPRVMSFVMAEMGWTTWIRHDPVRTSIGVQVVV